MLVCMFNCLSVYECLGVGPIIMQWHTDVLW